MGSVSNGDISQYQALFGWRCRSCIIKAMSNAKDIVTGIVYTRNLERSLIPAGVDGPLGDSLIVSGLIYRKPDQASAPVGTFDLTAVTTSVTSDRERRQVSIELSFDRRFARRSWISNLKAAFKQPKQAAEVSLAGVEDFPLGGGIPDRLTTFGVATGTGAFIGAEGTVSISYEPSTEFFIYGFKLV